MRILYLSDARIPSRSTNALQTMRMCDALARLGHEVSLVRPWVAAEKPEGWDGDVWSFYGVRERFRLVTLPAPLARRFASTRLARPVRAAVWGAYLFWRCRPGPAPFVCYARSQLAARLAQLARRVWGRRSSCRAVAVELHAEPASGDAVRRADAVYVISEALRQRLVAEVPALNGRVAVEHDGADLEALRPELLDREAARARLGLEGFVVVYTGRVNRVKGAEVVLAAAERVPDARFVLVGRVYDHELGAPNAMLAGYVPPARVAEYLAAADVLVLPSTASLPYAEYTSPLKLFEYMASGRPIVASDLPVLREILRDGENALLYGADDPEALAAAIMRLRSEPELGRRLAAQAWRDVQVHSWEARARRVAERLAAVGGVA